MIDQKTLYLVFEYAEKDLKKYLEELPKDKFLEEKTVKVPTGKNNTIFSYCLQLSHLKIFFFFRTNLKMPSGLEPRTASHGCTLTPHEIYCVFSDLSDFNFFNHAQC